MGALAIPLALAGLGLAGAAISGGGRSRTGAPGGTQLAPGTRRRTPTQQAQTRLGTDSRQPTANAQRTGRTAVPRGTATPRETSGTPTPPDTKKTEGDAQLAARRMATRTKRKGASQRPGTLLTGAPVGTNMAPRTLLGYA